jgi:pyruvate formate lyase activating enzyme
MPADAGEVVKSAYANGCGAISFTYNEGVVWPEFMLEVMTVARQCGLKNVLVTNGFVSERTWNRLLPWLDGIKIDLKGSNDLFYQRVVGIGLQAVLHSLNLIREHGTWHEISTVIIPGLNDSPEAIEAFTEIMLTHSDPNTPWHLMRFFPAYRRLDQQPGDIEDLRNIRRIAKGKGIAHVYISNVPGVPESSSDCRVCSQVMSVRGLGNKIPLPQQCLNCGEPICGRGLM